MPSKNAEHRREVNRIWRASENGRASLNRRRERVLAYNRKYRKNKYKNDPKQRARVSAYNRKWREAHKEQVQNSDRKKHLRAHFGITIDQYNELLYRQHGVCALCGKPPERIRLAVDHNHETQEVRGLLCGSCNRVLGIIEKRFKGLQSLYQYLNCVTPVDVQTLADGVKLTFDKKNGNFTFK